MLHITYYDDILSYSAQLIVPIITKNYPIGAVILLVKTGGKPVLETDIKVVLAISKFLGRQLESILIRSKKVSLF